MLAIVFASSMLCVLCCFCGSYLGWFVHSGVGFDLHWTIVFLWAYMSLIFLIYYYLCALWSVKWISRWLHEGFCVPWCAGRPSSTLCWLEQYVNYRNRDFTYRDRKGVNSRLNPPCRNCFNQSEEILFNRAQCKGSFLPWFAENGEHYETSLAVTNLLFEKSRAWFWRDTEEWLRQQCQQNHLSGNGGCWMIEKISL